MCEDWAAPGVLTLLAYTCVRMFILDQLPKECVRDLQYHSCDMRMAGDFLGINLSPQTHTRLEPTIWSSLTLLLNNEDPLPPTHTYSHHISKYRANDAHKSRHVHIVTVDFPLRSHNCRKASRTSVKGFTRGSLWQAVTLTGHKYYCSWWKRERKRGGGEMACWLIAMRKQTTLHAPVE